MVLKISHKRDHSSLFLSEASRKDLLSKSRRGSKERYLKRLNYQVSNFRGVDLSQLFNNDYFVFTTPINNYNCTIAFPGVLTELKEVARATYGDAKRMNLQLVIKALRKAFDKTDDVKVCCDCGDWIYRLEYWARHYGYLYGPGHHGTEDPPKKTNPNDNLGATCKHLDLFLSNKKWLVKAASVVNALIKTYPDKAAVYLYDEEDIKKDEDKEETPEEEEEEPQNEEVPEEETPPEEEQPQEDTTDEVPDENK